MGRPSLAPQRTIELLDAADRVILRDGVRAATVASIARESKTQASLIHHYLGSREQILDQAVQRTLRRVEDLMLTPLQSVSATNRLQRQLDVMFGPAFGDPLIEQMVEHLVVASYTDAGIRGRLTSMYARFADILEASLADARPEITKEQQQEISHAVVALAHAGPTLVWLRLDRGLAQSLRKAAGILVAQS